MPQSALPGDVLLAQRVGMKGLDCPDNNALHILNRFYTYRELLGMACKICKQIPAGRPYSRIGIYCTESVYSYASVLAVNLYGAAFIPLNPKFPAAKNAAIIKESGIDLILLPLGNVFPGIADGVEILKCEEIAGEIILPNASEITDLAKVKSDVCYIMFTSGSTGEPKGVPVSNENVNSCFNYFRSNYDFNEQDKFLLTYEMTFDVSVFSFFMPLLVGACCYVLPDEGIKPMKIVESLQKHKITAVSMVPGVLRYLEKYLEEISLPDLRYSFFSGDALFHALAVKWQHSLPNAAIHNFYGPTETTIVCTRYIFDEKRSASESVNGIVPLGKAFEGMEFIIVDENNEIAEKGELCFSGTQVISGYLNDKNEEKFFVYQNKRYYKTGDLAAVNESGNLVFYGRTDSQVKINGYRVELGEVEAAIRKVTGCNCLVICSNSGTINSLTAYVENEKLDEGIWMKQLREILPEYMLPKQFVAVSQFPLNVNGKVDKKALINSYI